MENNVENGTISNIYKSCDLEFDLGSSHKAYCNTALIDLYLHTKFHFNWTIHKELCVHGWPVIYVQMSERQTYRIREYKVDGAFTFITELPTQWIPVVNRFTFQHSVGNSHVRPRDTVVHRKRPLNKHTISDWHYAHKPEDSPKTQRTGWYASESYRCVHLHQQSNDDDVPEHGITIVINSIIYLPTKQPLYASKLHIMASIMWTVVNFLLHPYLW